MDHNVFVTVAAAAILILLATVLLRGRGRARSRPQGRRPKEEVLDTLSAWEPQGTRVLTVPELRALAMLHKALPEHYVLAQVPLARFIRVPTRRSYTEWLRRVGQLCPDLIVCDSSSQVLAAIEIRPPEAQASARAHARLERMRKVLKAAGIPLHVWPETALPNIQTIREVILAGLSTAEAPAPTRAPEPAHSARAPGLAPAGFTTAMALQASIPVADLLPPIEFDDDELAPDEVIEMREPPPSTWFDDLDTRPMQHHSLSSTGGLRPR